ncbi:MULTISPECIES: biotin synthase BioB [Chryseobacterium]|uniref:Biotin synthase n=1 Tax=Chryseobacterium camelliae TaxID=1265445 RepID=A0ABU0TGP7_9FLAO|nr:MULTISPECIES: biotin synthase BioB [Chryseobacterium]MDT3405959.1 biotin synthase [Pseudacidovorax intermedius]MDQ1096238.1 biotin synthase [Chryseobacterium camelliae]MDQ1100175.1 biotin synthase [Chryseobacterium sp. SORGH_AS_1048]MDR6087519.1 biotin synthase [Chryseobacterium sp. SORGH_AS_0909]MDR6131893.1 biotin synthase [Chryseobacterium sp. SORGH_AS_1175]
MNTKPSLRNDWTKQEIEEIYHSPLLQLVYRAATVHREWHNPEEIQMSTLLSIKTGGCPEDCSYCGQAARYHTNIKVQALLSIESVLEHARKAKDSGSSRFCMAAAWREVRNNRDFDRVIDMVKGVNDLGLEVCCTLGMLTEEQAVRLQEAGLYAYNHNLDTSEQYYEEIISTRTFDNRINTINNVRKAGITVCSGGIIGLGETHADRISMLLTLANMPKHPESVPINALARVAGTPLEENPKVDTWEMVRMIATARIVMPSSMVRLSAGRIEMTEFEQAWCFMAGANSIFTGERETLLVTPNPGVSEDMQLLNTLGLKPMGKREEVRVD